MGVKIDSKYCCIHHAGGLSFPVGDARAYLGKAGGMAPNGGMVTIFMKFLLCYTGTAAIFNVYCLISRSIERRLKG